MKKSLLPAMLSGFCALGFVHAVQADDTMTTQQHRSPERRHHQPPPRHQEERHHRERGGVSISFNVPAIIPPTETTFVKEQEYVEPERRYNRPRHHRRMRNIDWVDMYPGAPIPADAVAGGFERGNTLYVCRAEYRGGFHPGKTIGDNCNFSWGGKEIVLSRYQVLVSRLPLAWVPAHNGIPPNAVVGGEENGVPLYICQARYGGGATHPGKVIGNGCNIGYDGREIALPHFKVLVG